MVVFYFQMQIINFTTKFFLNRDYIKYKVQKVQNLVKSKSFSSSFYQLSNWNLLTVNHFLLYVKLSF